MMIRTKLILERFDKDMLRLERREQWSRSFIKNFMSMLYIAHYQLQPAAAFNIPTVDNQSNPIDVLGEAYGDYLISHNRIGGSAGFSMMPLTYANWLSRPLILMGCDLGIQVGTDNTVVTPTDVRLGHRIGNGIRAPDGAPLTFEQYTVNDDFNFKVYSTQWAAQPFMPLVDHRCASVAVKIWKTGSPGNLTVELRGVKSTYDRKVPGDTVIATGTIAEASIPAASPGSFITCTFGTPVDLYAGHIYFVVLHCGGNSSNYVNWRYDYGGATYERAIRLAASSNTRYLSSGDSGVSWSENLGACCMFQENGQSQGEFEYGGCELSVLSFVNPNGSFTIKRFFHNYCGSAITVQEVGIQSAAISNETGSSTAQGLAYPVLIARDVVAPGIIVNNNELLRVTYVPQITV